MQCQNVVKSIFEIHLNVKQNSGAKKALRKQYKSK